MSVELYRQGKLAESLVEALDVLVEEGKIPGPLALKVMEEASGGGGGARRRCLPGPPPPLLHPPLPAKLAPPLVELQASIACATPPTAHSPRATGSLRVQAGSRFMCVWCTTGGAQAAARAGK